MIKKYIQSTNWGKKGNKFDGWKLILRSGRKINKGEKRIKCLTVPKQKEIIENSYINQLVSLTTISCFSSWIYIYYKILFTLYNIFWLCNSWVPPPPCHLPCHYCYSNLDNSSKYHPHHTHPTLHPHCSHHTVQMSSCKDNHQYIYSALVLTVGCAQRRFSFLHHHNGLEASGVAQVGGWEVTLAL